MKKMIGYGFAFLVGAGALAFEMSESLNFWRLAFPAEKAFLAYLGFFLTSIAMLGYFYEFMYVAVGKTQKTVSLVMAFVCGIGALLTAGMGFQITSYTAQGWEFTKSDMEYMSLIVQGLIAAHVVALFVFYGGDAIANAWKDDDGDGIPNAFDRHDNRKKNNEEIAMRPIKSYQQQIAALQMELEASKRAQEGSKDKDGDNSRPTNGQKQN